MKPHLLRIVEISDEGTVAFEVGCPVGRGERCPYDVDSGLTDLDVAYCVVEEEFKMVGAEIIRGVATGSGPWPVKLTWEGSGEFTEGYIDLLPAPVPVVHSEAVLSA